MSDLPEPLTPLDCDLRDFAFMPLDVARLRDSDLVALETPEAFRAAVLLWCASWHQVPAASLPDDDRVLSKLAGYGYVVKEWISHRTGALRGWVKCADGRLYHPIVAEKANESWYKKVHYAWEKECDRIRKANKKREQEGKPALGFPPEPVLQVIQVPAESKGIPPEITSHSGGNGLNFHGTDFSGHDEQGESRLGQGAEVSSESSDAASKTGISGVPAESGGIPPETGSFSAGKSESSAGIPLENALKGEGQGQGEGEYIKPRSLSGPSTKVEKQEAGETTGDERSTSKRNVEIAVLLRNNGIKPFTFAHPLAVEWGNNAKVTDELLTAAVQSARDYKPEGDISPNYLKPIVEQLLNPPEAKPAKQPQDSWWSSNAGIERKGREIGLHPRPTEGYPEYKDRIFEELRKRGGKAA